MRTSSAAWMTVGILLGIFQWRVDGLQCLQCSSLQDWRCESGRLPASNCTDIDENAKFCVRYIGELSTGRIVYRDCSKDDKGATCMRKMAENETIKVCVTTCRTDGCNWESAAVHMSACPSGLCSGVVASSHGWSPLLFDLALIVSTILKTVA